MAWKSRKRVAEEDESDEYIKDGFVVADGSENDEDTHRPKKQKAPSSHQLSQEKQPKSRFPGDDTGVPGGGVEVDGVISWELSTARKVTVSQYQGKTFLSIREFYEKDGKSLPGKKGISLTLEQYYTLLKAVPHIESVLAQKGETVPRPEYDSAQTVNEQDMEEDEDDTAPQAADKGQTSPKKPNHEATSDEDE